MKYNFGMIKCSSTYQYLSKSKYQSQSQGINKLQMVDSHLLKKIKQHRLVQAVKNLWQSFARANSVHFWIIFWNSVHFWIPWFQRQSKLVDSWDWLVTSFCTSRGGQ